jgi:NTP pyrophosphatase (non-canonical NTP hydrolase)
MNAIESITERIKQFNAERDWEQFHNPKDLAISISVEANELLECFLWKNPDEADKSKIKEELADVLILAFQMAYRCGLDIEEIMNDKIALNAKKYPVEKAKGKATKYDKL